jgi:hypothetical protein
MFREMTHRNVFIPLKRFAARPGVGFTLVFFFWLVPCWEPPFIPKYLNFARFAGTLIAAGATALEMRRHRASEEADLYKRLGVLLRVLTAGVVAFVLILWFCVVPYRMKDETTVMIPVGFPGPSCCGDQNRQDCIRDKLNASGQAIEECWGEFPVNSVRLGLVASYWWMVSSSGAWVGLCMLLWGKPFRPRLLDVPPRDVLRTVGEAPISGETMTAELVARRELERKRAAGVFDVFLCHNSADKPDVKKIGKQLEERGILPWLDEWELRPGQPWQRLLEQQIGNIKSAAVFVGSAGVGPWQEQELEGFLSEFVSRQTPVIPVLLPDAPKKPKLPIFLRAMTWVDFGVQDPDPLDRLIWGITGKRPERLGE